MAKAKPTACAGDCTAHMVPGARSGGGGGGFRDFGSGGRREITCRSLSPNPGQIFFVFKTYTKLKQEKNTDIFDFILVDNREPMKNIIHGPTAEIHLKT